MESLARPTLRIARVALCAGASLAIATPSPAQVANGEILVNHFDPNDDLRHYEPDGTLVTGSQGGSGSGWVGAAITDAGTWVTSYRSPAAIGIFDSNGVEQSSFPIVLNGINGDVSLFADGTITVVDFPGSVQLYSQAGVHQGTYTTPGMDDVFGSGIDSFDELWVCGFGDETIWHLARDGTPLAAINTAGFGPADVDFGLDDSLWVIGYDGRVRHYSRTGTLLGSFVASTGTPSWGIAVAPDGSLWVTGFGAQRLIHYDQSGNALGEFPTPDDAVFLSIPRGLDATTYCSPAVANSTGNPAVIGAAGSPMVSDNDVTLSAAGLPPNQFGYFLNSMTQAFVFPVPGSQGALCLGGQIGRYTANVFNTGATGTSMLVLDLTSTPTPTGPVAIAPGETWNFTCWYRDQNPGPTSNFTDGVSILFQ